MRTLICWLAITFIFFSCRKDNTRYFPTPYNLEIPSHFPDMIIPADNPMTVEGVELGRFLFYEKRLSGDNTQSCASCHLPSASFSDPNQYSTGIDGIQGTRHSMALVNLGWEDFFFWDGRKTTLETQILEPVPNPIEMHQSWKRTVEKLNADVNYRNRFFKAFGEEGIDSIKATKAIAQFIRTLISGDSKYDVMYKYENNLSLNSSEQAILQTVDVEEWAGYDLFKSLNGADCFHCHNGPLMRVKKFSNNGLMPNSVDDRGRAGVTNNPEDNYKFKVPTLRNIALTAPYMHDGRFATLDEVIEHYSSGIHMSPTIDPLIEFGSQGGVQLDAQEKYLLKKFLLTLTDQKFVLNPNFQDPN
ncbi:MAG TPA: cytochrome-c peroxidase [Crocinitomicaceae bacterium]|nr:cytochrome-c peroxidase [Flavobacteriales bacterium]HBW86917.1 cytochrome-c peroxidase [Crocinitomicaceae bacterium]